MTLILGIESSCDETAAAVVELVGGRPVVRSSVVATQHELHAEYRGVVPEIASRAHLERVLPVMEKAVAEAGVSLGELGAVAIGNRPGLIGSLIVGASAGKALAWALGLPVVGVDHVTAHLVAADLVEGRRAKDEGRSGEEKGERRRGNDEPVTRATGEHEDRESVGALERSSAVGEDRETSSFALRPSSFEPSFPRLGLVVSGGHTTLYRVEASGEIARLGGTIDDAVGEAFDKAAVILGLPYPGGPEIDRLAQSGDPAAVRLPRSMLGKESLDFSFSGLKTALLYAVRGKPVGKGKDATFERDHTALSEQQRADLAASFQAAAVDALIVKLERAFARMRDDGAEPASIVIGGGVSANSRLRSQAEALGERLGVAVRVPAMRYCVDNAAMIAAAAGPRVAAGDVDDLSLPVLATGSR
ncbi:MAG: tRNA (adenosine(37)-N6)-threonylcarbamoyltransferase complex transferase subunit TsaD [Planctomycetota bacterium]